jgi:hypothetical protein
MIIVIYQAGVGGVSDSEPGAKNGFLGVQALRIHVCTYIQSRISYPFRTTPLFDLGLIYISGGLSSLSQHHPFATTSPSISILFSLTSAMIS